MNTLINVLIICIVLISQILGAKILAFFPTPSISHQMPFRPLTQELAKRGHEVVVITPDPEFSKGKTPANLTEIDVHDVSYSKWYELFDVISPGETDLIAQMKPTFIALSDIVEIQLNVPEVQLLIKEEKFDLIFVEACVRSALVVTHIFKAPVIQVGTFGFANFNIDTIGAAKHPLLYPHVLSQKTYNLSKWEKITAVWNYLRLEKMTYDIIKLEEAMIGRMLGENFPTINELENNVDMMFLNTHPVWADNRPVPPNFVYMWGINEKPTKELPTDLKNYLDSSKNGVIYMSLGTNVKPSMLQSEKIQMLIRVFSELPYDVLWKWDLDELPGRTKNIRISKWLPQNDLLRHPKIKVFVTQGGLQSTEEAIAAGVPMIGIPILGDQWYNVEKYVYHKIGIHLDFGSLTEDQFSNAIEAVIGNASYRQNIARLYNLMHDDPQSPLERAVWWTEYVLRHEGAKHLRSPAANMTYAEYFELKLVLILLFTFLLISCGVFLLVCNICQRFRKKLHKKIKEKQS